MPLSYLEELELYQDRVIRLENSVKLLSETNDQQLSLVSTSIRDSSKTDPSIYILFILVSFLFVCFFKERLINAMVYLSIGIGVLRAAIRMRSTTVRQVNRTTAPSRPRPPVSATCIDESCRPSLLPRTLNHMEHQTPDNGSGLFSLSEENIATHNLMLTEVCVIPSVQEV